MSTYKYRQLQKIVHFCIPCISLYCMNQINISKIWWGRIILITKHSAGKTLENVLWNRAVKATADMGSNYCKSTVFWHYCFIFKLFFCFRVYFLWLLLLVRSGYRCTACCTVSSSTGMKKNVCTCLKYQPCGVVVPGQQAGILKSLVAPARLLPAAVSYEWAHRETC